MKQTLASRHLASRQFWTAMGLCLLFAGPSWAQWKWRDANGQVQYSDRPPPSAIKDKDILQRPSGQHQRVQVIPSDSSATPTATPISASSPASAPMSPAEKAQRDKRAAELLQQKQAHEQQQARIKADNCQRARAHLNNLDSGMRMAQPNEKGESVFMDDAQRAAERQRTAAIVAADCR